VLLSFCLAKPAVADIPEESIIVEKNLFSPERKKWLMPDENEKKKKKQRKKNEHIDDIVLSGTIVTENMRSAILSLKPKTRRRRRRRNYHRNPGTSQTYRKGDYIGGYLIRQIQESFVVLQDESVAQDYKIFLYESGKDRTPVKTEIKDTRARAKKTAREKALERKKKRGIITTPAQTTSMLTERLEKSIGHLEHKYNRLVMKQADRDFEKIKKTYPALSRAERKNIRELKQKLESLKKKYKQP